MSRGQKGNSEVLKDIPSQGQKKILQCEYSWSFYPAHLKKILSCHLSPELL